MRQFIHKSQLCFCRPCFSQSDAKPFCSNAFRPTQKSDCPGLHPLHPSAAHISNSQASLSLEGQQLETGWSILEEATKRNFVDQHIGEEQQTLRENLTSPIDADFLLKGCEPEKKLKVGVLLSGGVDSSLALYLLKKAGHDVTAFYLQIWFQEDFSNFWGACPWEDDLAVCEKVCEQLDVPLKVVPLTEEYWARVVEESISSIKKGWTPNPDIACNTRVKFGAFYEYLDQNGDKFDRIASGHYASISRDSESGCVSLRRSPDEVKDQTYFLSYLSQKQLSRVMFPIGHLSKSQVRQLANMVNLPNMARRDSQGICFLGKVKFDEFVEKHLGTWHGPFVDEDTNEVVGFHNGFWFYTPGQRKGIELSGGPWYVSQKDIRKNVVYISRKYHVPDRIRNHLRCGQFAWISGEPPTKSNLLCKARHGPQIYECMLSLSGDGCGDVVLDGNDQGLAPGQYAVFYDGQNCLGAGVILPSE